MERVVRICARSYGSVFSGQRCMQRFHSSNSWQLCSLSQNFCADSTQECYVSQSQITATRHFSQASPLLAGHSKWNNIRHAKSANDDRKQKIVNQIVNRINVAVALGGSTDPKLNSQLAKVLEIGKSKDVPNNTMEQTLKKLASAKGKVGQTHYIEAKGVANSFLMIEVVTDRFAHMRQQLQSVLKKFNGTTGDSGLASHSFCYKGVVFVPMEDSEISADQATELAIEAGAEEVEEGLDEDQNKVYRFLCEPAEAHNVKNNLEGLGVKILEVQFNYLPLVFLTLQEVHMPVALQMLDQLEGMAGVIRVYHNIDMS